MDDRLGSGTIGHFRHKSISKLRQRLDVAGLFRIVSQRRADLVDGEVDPPLEVDERGFTPQMTLNLGAADHLAVTVQEQQENLDGLRRQFDRSSALEELTGRTVDLEDAESNYWSPDGEGAMETYPDKWRDYKQLLARLPPPFSFLWRFNHLDANPELSQN